MLNQIFDRMNENNNDIHCSMSWKSNTAHLLNSLFGHWSNWFEYHRWRFFKWTVLCWILKPQAKWCWCSFGVSINFLMQGVCLHLFLIIHPWIHHCNDWFVWALYVYDSFVSATWKNWYAHTQIRDMYSFAVLTQSKNRLDLSRIIFFAHRCHRWKILIKFIKAFSLNLSKM